MVYFDQRCLDSMRYTLEAAADRVQQARSRAVEARLIAERCVEESRAARERAQRVRSRIAATRYDL